MQDKELLELCKKVYQRTGWKDTLEAFYIPVDFKSNDVWVKTEHNYDDSKMFWYCPLYTSDYILEKLPDETGLQNPRIEKGVFVQKQSTTTVAMRYRAAYKFASLRSQYADTPLKALLKLVIALDDAGQLGGKTNG